MWRRLDSARERPVTGLLRACYLAESLGDSDYYPGMTSANRGEIAGMGRRFAALTLDWLMSWAVGSLAFDQAEGRPIWVAAVFFFEIVLFTTLTGSSAGQRILNLSVGSCPDGQALGFGKILLRTALILLVIPAVVFDSDGRGLHDRIVQSAVFKR